MRNEAHMNYLRRKTADEAELWAANLIEELERTIEVWKASFVTKNEQFDALLADNARLHGLLADCQDMFDPDAGSSHVHHKLTVLDIRNALAATPEQSLARLRNQVREECAGVCDRFAEREMHPAECAAAILAMKEPE